MGTEVCPANVVIMEKNCLYCNIEEIYQDNKREVHWKMKKRILLVICLALVISQTAWVLMYMHVRHVEEEQLRLPVQAAMEVESVRFVAEAEHSNRKKIR